MIGYQEIASRYNKNFTFELKCKIMGKQSHELASSIINELNLPLTVEGFIVETRKIFDELFLQSKVMPGNYNIKYYFHIFFKWFNKKQYLGTRL